MIKIAIISIIVLGFFQTNIKLENENHAFLKKSSEKTLYIFNKDNISKTDYIKALNALNGLEKTQITIYVKMPVNISAKEEQLILSKLEEIKGRILQKNKLKLQTRVFYYKLLTISNWEIILNT